MINPPQQHHLDQRADRCDDQGCHHDAAERSRTSKAERAVAADDLHVRDLLCLEVVAGGLRQVLDRLAFRVRQRAVLQHAVVAARAHHPPRNAHHGGVVRHRSHHY